MPVMARRILGDGSGGEMGHKKKEKGVSGHMEIEVDETVHQKSATGDQAGEVQGGGKGFVGDQQLFQRSEEQKAQKRGAAERANQAGVGQHLQVIVVGVINKFGVIQAF